MNTTLAYEDLNLSSRVRCVVNLIESSQEIFSAVAQWAVILVAAILPLALIADAVRRLRRSSIPGPRFPRQKRAGYVSAVGGAFVYVLPIILLVHNVRAREPWDWNPFQYAMIGLVVLAIAGACVAPKYARVQLILGGLIPFLFWLLIPHGGVF
jgi:hypothetical protein